MRRFLGVAAALLALGGVAAPASAAAHRGDVYVSPAGSDLAPGTARRPVRSPERDRDIARSMSGARTVHLAAGVYRWRGR